MAEKCKEMVYDTLRWRHYHCERNAKRDGYCKQHHPDAVKARRDASAAKRKATHDAVVAAAQARKDTAHDAVIEEVAQKAERMACIDGQAVLTASEIRSMKRGEGAT